MIAIHTNPNPTTNPSPTPRHNVVSNPVPLYFLIPHFNFLIFLLLILYYSSSSNSLLSTSSDSDDIYWLTVPSRVANWLDRFHMAIKVLILVLNVIFEFQTLLTTPDTVLVLILIGPTAGTNPLTRLISSPHMRRSVSINVVQCASAVPSTIDKADLLTILDTS